MGITARAVIVAGVALFAAAGTARAQGALVSGSVAAAIASDHASPSYGGGVTWRFNRVLGLGAEATYTSGLASDFPAILCCGPDQTSRLTTFTTNVRLEIPTISTRVIPFVIGGGGVGSLTTSSDVLYPLAQAIAAGLVEAGLPPLLSGSTRVENTSTEMALTLGGGASFLVTAHVSIDADLRVLHLMGDTSRNIGRFGGGIGYRF